MEAEVDPNSSFDLLSFADELLLCVIEQIDCRDTLCNLGATCSRLQGLTEPFIWRSLFVMRGDHARRIAQACSSEPQRLLCIQDLSIRYKHTVESGIEVLDSAIYQMEKLRHLHIESPCPNNDPWRQRPILFNSYTRVDYTALFEASVGTISPIPFQNLQSLNLHGHSQDRPFTFGRNAVIFLHPTIRHITLACCDFEADMRLEDLPEKSLKSTPLKSLTFIECNIYLQLLDIILCLPRALEDLSLGERIYHFSGCYPKPLQARTFRPALAQVLKKQASSLRRIEHSGKNHGAYHAPPQGDTSQFRDLFNIKQLEVSINSVFVRALERGHYPRSLEHLKLTDRGCLPFHADFLVFQQFGRAIRSLSQMVNIDLLFTHFGLLGNEPLVNLEALWKGKAARSQIYTMTNMVIAQGKRLQVFAHGFEGGQAYIPPYMYGETTPTEVLVYDSIRRWEFYGTNYEQEDNEALKESVVEAAPAAAAVEMSEASEAEDVDSDFL